MNGYLVGDPKMRVCVFGIWHLGSVIAAGLAARGHDVTGLEYDNNIVQSLKSGSAPVFEPGLDELLKTGLAQRHLSFTSSAKDALKDTEIIWVTFDTPVDDDDRANACYVIDQVKSIIPYLGTSVLILLSSQLPSGSIQKLEVFAKESVPNKDLSFAYSPENLRLGDALNVFLNPDRMIVGVRTSQDQRQLENLLKPISNKIIWMSVESAEMTKHAINAFLGMSVAFANEIASVCELVGANAREVEQGLKTDKRIGPRAYLSPGSAFSGGTLARDLVFLDQITTKNRLNTPLLSSILMSNDEHKKWVQRRLNEYFPSLLNKKIAIWGLTYKPDTNTLRRSLAIDLCNWLLDNKAQIFVHDPVVDELPEGWGKDVIICNSPEETLSEADGLVICTEWALYKKIRPELCLHSCSKFLVVDANCFVPQLAQLRAVQYQTVGNKG